jgi:hypothetical protein
MQDALGHVILIAFRSKALRSKSNSNAKSRERRKAMSA